MNCIICGSWFASTIHDGACPTCSRAIKQLRLNMTANRLMELAQAEKDGRLVVLPSNDPLTIEELQEMDGEPVWIERGLHPQAGWALVRVWSKWSKAKNATCLIYRNGNTEEPGCVLADGGKIYRRKPEEETNGNSN